MTRAIIVSGTDVADIAAALGYPYPSYNAATGEIVPGILTLRHRDVEKDDQGRDVLAVDEVESALPAPLRARVVNVTKAVAVEAIE